MDRDGHAPVAATRSGGAQSGSPFDSAFRATSWPGSSVPSNNGSFGVQQACDQPAGGAAARTPFWGCRLAVMPMNVVEGLRMN